MTTEELEELSSNEEIVSLHFDGYAFRMKFANGVSVSAEYNDGWDIESNTEKEQREEEYRQRAKMKLAQQQLTNQLREEVLSKFPENKREAIKSILK